MPHVAEMTRNTATEPRQDAERPMPETVSLGCRLNGYESEKMAELAASAGVSDALIINSCAVTNEAVRQTRQTIRRAHRDQPNRRIIVTGCAAQIDPGSFTAMPEVATVLGNTGKLDRQSWAALAKPEAPSVLHSDIMYVTGTSPSPPLQQPGRARAYVQVQNGCDHRCTFCIIPFGRGNSRSVPIQDLVAEVQSLVDQGLKEVVLTGVDITSYGADLPGAPSLGHLVRRLLNDVPDLPRLRLSSIDGAEIDETLFELITTEERLAQHLHLSLQAGDNMILKRMKRRHTREQAIEFCAAVRTKRPEVLFGADIIAGFPTETDDMFSQSLALVDECGLTYLHVFPYSARQGTPAARMPQLPGDVIKERAARLREKGDTALADQLQKLCGQTATILTEKAGKDGRGRGRLANFAEVYFDSQDRLDLLEPGHFCDVRLNGHDGRILQGTLTGDDST